MTPDAAEYGSGVLTLWIITRKKEKGFTMMSSIDVDNKRLAREAYCRSVYFACISGLLLLFFSFASLRSGLGLSDDQFFFFLWVSTVVGGLHFSVFLVLLGRFKRPSKLLFVVGILLQGYGLFRFAFGKFTDNSGMCGFFWWSLVAATVAFGGCLIFRGYKR